VPENKLNPLNGLMVKNQAKRQNLKLKICEFAVNHKRSAKRQKAKGKSLENLQAKCKKGKRQKAKVFKTPSEVQKRQKAKVLKTSKRSDHIIH
jgi:hypothetical protein